MGLEVLPRISLLDMAPRGNLSPTGYALANPGQEYLVLEPSGSGSPFTVRLEPGTYAAEWFSIQDRQAVPAQATTVDHTTATSFRAPPEASGPTVLYLKRGSTT